MNEDHSNSADSELNPLVDAAGSSVRVRNKVGMHFTISGMEIPDMEVRVFGQGIQGLAGALICDTCGELPRKAKSGTDRQYRCGKQHLQPLETPL